MDFFNRVPDDKALPWEGYAKKRNSGEISQPGTAGDEGLFDKKTKVFEQLASARFTSVVSVVRKWPNFWEKMQVIGPFIGLAGCQVGTAIFLTRRILPGFLITAKKTRALLTWATVVVPFMYQVNISAAVVALPLFQRPFDQCSLCLAARQLGINLVTGVGLPYITAPLFSLMVLNFYPDTARTVPKLKSLSDMPRIVSYGVRITNQAAGKYVPMCALINFIAVYSCMYVMEGGRNRILLEMEQNPEFAQEILYDEASGSASLWSRLKNVFKS